MKDRQGREEFTCVLEVVVPVLMCVMVACTSAEELEEDLAEL
jgi:hypothetical protein